MSNQSLTPTCGLHDIVVRHNEEFMTKLAADIVNIRNDIRQDIGGIREDIRTLTDLISGLNLLRASQDTLRKELDYVWIDIKDIKQTVAELVLEKERLVTATTLEKDRFRKDLDSAHDSIREITSHIEKEFSSINSFMNSMKSGIRLSQYLAGGVPTICILIYWLITKLYHIG